DITLYDLAGRMRHRIELPEAKRLQMSVAFHPSGRELYWMYQAADRKTGAIPPDSAKIHVLDLETLKETCLIDTDASKLRFADQGLAVSHARKNISLWHVPSRTRVKVIPF